MKLNHKVISTILAALLIIADQITKIIAFNWYNECVDKGIIAQADVITGIFEFKYTGNKGAAFGILANSPWVFMTATVIFLVAALFIFFKYKFRHAFVDYSLMLIICGGIGNMIDRIFRGFVIDFINVTFIQFYIFNIADCCVVVGCIFIILYLIYDTFHLKKDTVKEFEEDRTES